MVGNGLISLDGFLTSVLNHFLHFIPDSPSCSVLSAVWSLSACSLYFLGSTAAKQNFIILHFLSRCCNATPSLIDYFNYSSSLFFFHSVLFFLIVSVIISSLPFFSFLLFRYLEGRDRILSSRITLFFVL